MVNEIDNPPIVKQEEQRDIKMSGVDNGSKKPYLLRNRISVMFYQLSERLNIFVLQECNKRFYKSVADNHYVETIRTDPIV